MLTSVLHATPINSSFKSNCHHPTTRTRCAAKAQVTVTRCDRGRVRSHAMLVPGEMPTPRMERWRIFTAAIAMCGIQVCYSAQINLGTSQLLLLGIPERAVSLAWLAGPISGLLMQPLVGHFSDNCTSSLGRRRPFLIAGAVFTSGALLLFSNAQAIAGESAAPALAVFSFFLLDFSIQAIQAPLRALITDVVPRAQRPTGNAYVGVFSGLGNLLGSLLTAANLSTILPVSDTQAVFACAVVILLFTVGICVFTTKEQPYHHRIDTQDDDVSESRSVFQVLKDIPRPFWRVFAVQLCTWCGFFTLFVYINAWVGRNVFLGDGTAAAGSEKREVFEEGVRLGGKGNAATAAVTLLYSLLLPGLLKRLGVVPIYAFSQVIEAICLMVTPLLRGSPGGPSVLLRLAIVSDIGLFGIVWSTTMGVPWTLIGNALESDERYAKRIGLFQTIFNASQSGPQLIVGCVAPLILAISDDDPAAVMFLGGVCALLGAALILILRVGEETNVEKAYQLAPQEDNDIGENAEREFAYPQGVKGLEGILLRPIDEERVT